MSKRVEPPFVIIVDTREQQPYTFAGLATVRKKLDAGDYSIEGYEDKVAVERKSYADIWGSMSVERGRFKRCVERLAELDRAAIVIECSLTKLCEQPSRIERTTPASVVGGLVSWAVQYQVGVFFCDTRYFAERITARFLASYFKHLRPQ